MVDLTKDIVLPGWLLFVWIVPFIILASLEVLRYFNYKKQQLKKEDK